MPIDSSVFSNHDHNHNLNALLFRRSPGKLIPGQSITFQLAQPLGIALSPGLSPNTGRGVTEDFESSVDQIQLVGIASQYRTWTSRVDGILGVGIFRFDPVGAPGVFL